MFLWWTGLIASHFSHLPSHWHIHSCLCFPAPLMLGLPMWFALANGTLVDITWAEAFNILIWLVFLSLFFIFHEKSMPQIAAGTVWNTHGTVLNSTHILRQSENSKCLLLPLRFQGYLSGSFTVTQHFCSNNC